MSSEEKPMIAFVLSLIGGVLIAVNGGVMLIWFMAGGWGFGGMMGGLGGMMSSMMGGYQGMMGSFGVPFGFMSGFMLAGLASGIIVIIGALMLNARPTEHAAWGMIILIFSIIGFLGMGGFFVGAILGIIGGAFALSWSPVQTLSRIIIGAPMF